MPKAKPTNQPAAKPKEVQDNTLDTNKQPLWKQPNFSVVLGSILASFVVLAGIYLIFFAQAGSILDGVDWRMFYPSDDSYVSQQDPTTPHGGDKLMYVSALSGDCAPADQCNNKALRHAYLKFDVKDIPADKVIKRVILRVHTALFPTGSSPQGGIVYPANNSNWVESGINWNNRPGARDKRIGSLGGVKAGGWYSIELDQAGSGVVGNGSYSFVVQSQNADAALYHSKESDYKPSLVVILAPKPVPPVKVVNIPSNIASQTTCKSSSTNVTDKISQWLATVPAGAIARFGANKCYRSEGTVMVAVKAGVTIDGNGSKLQAFTDGCADQSNDGKDFNNCKYTSSVKGWPRSRKHLSLSGLKNVTIKNLWIDGGYTKAGSGGYDSRYEAQHGLSFNDTAANDGVTIDNVHVDRVRGDYIYFGSTSAQNNVTVKNSLFGADVSGNKKSGNGRQMVAITNGTNLKFVGNTFLSSARSGVDFEPLRESAVIKNVYFDNNTFGSTRLNWIAMSGYAGVNPVFENIFFRNNKLKGEAMSIDSQTPCTPDVSKPDPVGTCAKTPNPNNASTYRRRNFQFIGNVSDATYGNTAGREILITGVDGLIFKDNAVVEQIPRDGRSMVVINVFYSRNVSISGNKAKGSFNKNTAEAGFDVASHIGRYAKNTGLCESGNQVASSYSTSAPLVADSKQLKTTCP